MSQINDSLTELLAAKGEGDIGEVTRRLYPGAPSIKLEEERRRMLAEQSQRIERMLKERT